MVRKIPSVFLLVVEERKITNRFHNSDLVENIDSVVSEFQDLFISHYRTQYRRGIHYSRAGGTYYYLQKLLQSNEGKLYFLLTQLSIEYAVNYYYTTEKLENLCVQTFEKIVADEVMIPRDQLKETMDHWETVFMDILGETPNPYTQVFHHHAITKLMEIFADNLSEVLFAILLKIPMLIQNIPTQEIEILKDAFTQIAPLQITVVRTPVIASNQSYYQVFFSEKALQSDNFNEVFHYDFPTDMIRFSCNLQLHNYFKDLVQNAIDAHQTESMPFFTSIYVKIISLIEKIFVILSMDQESIDFNQFLHPEEKDMKAIYDHIFDEIAFIPHQK